ncbi:MAG: hypothetical protein Fur006_33590 [Coleofasciculaceae cyanobacterium]
MQRAGVHELNPFAIKSINSFVEYSNFEGIKIHKNRAIFLRKLQIKNLVFGYYNN